MFFIMGITSGRKNLNFRQFITCNSCGMYGQFTVFMTYNVLTLFFIPTIKWNRRYYVQTSCCGTVYELDAEIGKAIARGENVEIMQENLTRVYSGRGYSSSGKKCDQCGYETSEDFDYCPKCGARLS